MDRIHKSGLALLLALWAGGAIVGRLRKVPEGVRLLASLPEISQALADWRARRHAQAA